MVFLPFYMVNNRGWFRTYFKSLIFGFLSYFSSFWLGEIMHDLNYFKSNKSVFLSFLLIPALIFSFINLKLNKSTKYKRNIGSILNYSLTISFSLLFHLLIFSKVKIFNWKVFLTLGILFMIALSLAHFSYLFVLIFGKKAIKEDIIDN